MAKSSFAGGFTMYNKNFRKAIGMIMAFAMIISFLPVSAYGIVTSDTTPPTLLSASRTSDTSITVTLSENCANLTKTGDGGFTVTQTSGTATYTVSATAQVIDLKHVKRRICEQHTDHGNAERGLLKPESFKRRRLYSQRDRRHNYLCGDVNSHGFNNWRNCGIL